MPGRKQIIGDTISTNSPLPIFRKHHRLADRIPWTALGTGPTPVEPLDIVAKEFDIGGLHVKRDDLSGEHYGGNKVRKLEFLLADARRKGAKEVVTFGFSGSNHAVATALYAQQLGLNCTVMLMPQINAHYVRRNILACLHFGADLRPVGGMSALFWAFLRHYIQSRRRHNVPPYYIPAGGTCPLGILGYVNAAFELKDQIASGYLPEPDVVYVPFGSMGTSAGLSLGFSVLGLKTQIAAVRVIEKKIADKDKVLRQIGKTARFLGQHDPSFAIPAHAPDNIVVRHEFIGDGYARFTPEAVLAARVMKQATGIVMNGAYSAKAFAALLHDGEAGALRGKNVLFWNTYNSRPLPAGSDWRTLPKELRRYFEEDVQPLDAAGQDR